MPVWIPNAATCRSCRPSRTRILLIAGVALRGLWASTDGGATWHAFGTGDASSGPITNRTSSIVYDPDHPERFWESGIYDGGGVYITSDDGETFSVLGDSHHVDLVSIDFEDPDRKTLVAGGHEQSRTLYQSSDRGATWANIGLNFRNATDVCTRPLVLTPSSYLVGCSTYDGGVDGIQRTTDSGKTWSRVTNSVGGASEPLTASDGAIYWTTAGGGMAKSVDGGRTFTQIEGSEAITSQSPRELPGGSIVALGRDYVMLSRDHGATWDAVSSKLPYQDAVGVAYSRQERAFFIWHFTCADTVPADAIMRYDFDYEKD